MLHGAPSLLLLAPGDEFYFMTTPHHTMIDLLKYSAQNCTELHRKTPYFYDIIILSLTPFCVAIDLDYCSNQVLLSPYAY